MKSLIKALKRTFPIDQFFFHKSYAQEGEDLVYRSFFENRKGYKGFYVDVGAHHPFRFSNTLRFYHQGWSGINIEPTPKAIKLFRTFRKRDINLNIGIDLQEGTLPFYCFNEPALNSFSKEIAEHKAANTRYRIKEVIPIKTMPLAKILNQYLPAAQTIDVLNIDAEGLDLRVLQSNNWDRYKPVFILVEAALDLRDVTSSEVYMYLTDLNYELVAKTMRTLFFRLSNS
jgi:FkbM family methyltransferase